MKTVLATALSAILMLAGASAGYATETGQAEVETPAADTGLSTPPAEAADQETGKQEGEEATDESKDIMQNFTRHRPGACPEGPPCKVED